MIRRLITRLAIVAAASVVLGLLVLAGCWWLFPFPADRLDRMPASPVITDRTGRVMVQSVATDDQWRMPAGLDEMSPWLVKATLAAEDARFREHCGIDGRAAARAAWQDLTSWRRVSGASTLTMQVCRMMEDEAAGRSRPRTVSAKTVESFRALQLERLRSKDEILTLYLNMAPYGRNVRGAEAASLLWFGKHARDLSLGEAALLAGMPQSPTRYQPVKFLDAVRTRRRTVLRRMCERGMISAEQRDRAADEPIALAGDLLQPDPRRSLAPHAAMLALAQRPAGGRTTLDLSLQAEVVRLAREHASHWPGGTDCSVVVLDIESGEVRAMLGSLDASDPRAGQVCGATAWRSPGSALKPFIYAAAFETRRLAPDSAVYDIRIQRAGWSPDNFDRTFGGEMHAGDALRLSRNVPAILLLENVGLPRCVGLMRSAGLDFRDSPESRGGLATAVGAVEVRLIDLTNAYATIGRGGVRRNVRLFDDDPACEVRAVDANVCAALDEVLSSRARRPAGLESLADDQTPWFAWKTGTSYGRRDAWAVGHNHRFAIGVWVGRFDGRPDPQFVGGGIAEPLLADLFCLGGLRNHSDPPAPKSWVVEYPFPRPAEAGERVQITFPSPDARFLAVAGTAVIRPQVNTRDRLDWFLNGRLIASEDATRLVLTAGRYELRCLGQAGQSSAVRFSVR